MGMSTDFVYADPPHVTFNLTHLKSRQAQDHLTHYTGLYKDDWKQTHMSASKLGRRISGKLYAYYNAGLQKAMDCLAVCASEACTLYFYYCEGYPVKIEFYVDPETTHWSGTLSVEETRGFKDLVVLGESSDSDSDSDSDSKGDESEEDDPDATVKELDDSCGTRIDIQAYKKDLPNRVWKASTSPSPGSSFMFLMF